MLWGWHQYRSSCRLKLAVMAATVLSCFLGTSVSVRGSTVVSLGPIRLLPKKGAFAWRASVDRTSGVASSLETSIVPKKSRLRKKVNSTHDDEMLELSKDLFSDYPVWLCRFPVTFGVIKAVPTGGGYELRDRIFGCNLLTFAKGRADRLSIRTESRKGVPIQTSQCTITHAIVGGVLSLPLKKWMKQEASIVCTLAMRRAVGSHGTKESCTIVTQLVGYRPSLVGNPPVNLFRAWFYLCSQSQVHAYAMWRLHRRCWNFKNAAPSQNA